MGEVARTDGTPAVTIATGDPARLREQIEATRAELGDTVAALAVKADVKRQAQERIDGWKQQARAMRERLSRRGGGDGDAAGEPRASEQLAQAAREQVRAHPLVVAATAAVACGFLLGRLTKR